MPAAACKVLYVDDDLYIMQREGYLSQSGLVFVLNNRGDRWNGKTLKTRWNSTDFRAVAWAGYNDFGVPQNKATNQDGFGDFWSPPRGYAIYVPS